MEKTEAELMAVLVAEITSKIIALVENHPNDQELGKAVRELMNSLKSN